MKRLKILEVTAFSAGFCGVGTRVLAESHLLGKKHDVTVFSSNILRGTAEKKYAPLFEKSGNIKIYRFPTFWSFGQNTFFWNYEKKALALKPDIIITHAYRQYYSTKALKIAKKLGIPCILVTHAPFLDKKLRNWKLNLAVFLYDNFIGKRIINQYSKIFSITKWEMPYLEALGVKKEKIVYIPNGIPDEFFKIKIKKSNSQVKKILFLGRIAPVKDIETLIRAFNLVKNSFQNAELDLVGPVEKEYKPILEKVLNETRVKVNFLGPVYDLKKKISLLDSADIFILPSRREAMPQALIEAMSREKLVISSKTDGGKEIIENMKTGLLFDIGDEKQLADQIIFSCNPENKDKIRRIEKSARNYVSQFSWSKLIKKIEETIE